MANNRRTHSVLDQLPAALRVTITSMVTDDQWPADFKGQRYDGRPRYEDVVAYCRQFGFEVSKSAVGRWAKRLRMLSKMKTAGMIARDVMSDLTAEKASATQKAAAEMITAHIIEFAAENADLSSRQIKEVAQAVRECTAVSINADKYIHDQLNAKAQKAEQEISKIAKKKKIDPETLKAIREQIYGIVTQ
jgi:hypothetical protein